MFTKHFFDRNNRGIVQIFHHVLICVSCSRAFQEYYQEHLEYACPTEDIYLE